MTASTRARSIERGAVGGDDQGVGVEGEALDERAQAAPRPGFGLGLGQRQGGLPKQEVVWVPATATLADALAIMEPHRHSAVPLCDAAGRYAGTLTEGDVLWHLRHGERDWREVASSAHVGDIAPWMRNEPIRVDAEIDALVARAAVQNFVPVVDDRGIFVGLVLRKTIIEHCLERAGQRPPR